MVRLTIQLPATLQNQLEALADRRGLSLSEYIVYVLRRQATQIYAVQPMPEDAKRRQRESFAALLENLGEASSDEIEAVMAEREPAEPEAGLTSEVVERLRERLANAQADGRPSDSEAQ